MVRSWFVAVASVILCGSVAAGAAPPAEDSMARPDGPPFGSMPPGPPPMGPGFPGFMPPPFGHGEHRPLSPQAHCLDEVAHEAGFVRYISVRLDLTQTQRPLWEKLEDITRAAEDKRRESCRQLPAAAEDKPPALPQRLAQIGDELAQRAAELQQAQPAVAALYQSLSPEQRALLDGMGPPAPVPTAH